MLLPQRREVWPGPLRNGLGVYADLVSSSPELIFDPIWNLPRKERRDLPRHRSRHLRSQAAAARRGRRRRRPGRRAAGGVTAAAAVVRAGAARLVARRRDGG